MIGKVFEPEWDRYKDPATGVQLMQYTNGNSISSVLYFTENDTWGNGRHFIFVSERDGEYNLFSMDRENGRFTQLTEGGVSDYCCNIDTTRSLVYYKKGSGEVYQCNLFTLETKKIYQAPEGCIIGKQTVTCDGKQFVFPMQLPGEPHAASIVSVDIDTGESRTVFQSDKSIKLAHANASPTLRNIITYCHEGAGIDLRLQTTRIWCLDLDTGETWPIHERTNDDRTTHEFWLADGKNIGYEWNIGFGPWKRKTFGISSWKNEQIFAGNFDYENSIYYGSCKGSHLESYDGGLVVSERTEGGSVLRVWKKTDDGYSAPRVLCSAYSPKNFGFDESNPHVLEGNKIVRFSRTDGEGITNVYEAYISEFESLPLAEEFFKDKDRREPFDSHLPW